MFSLIKLIGRQSHDIAVEGNRNFFGNGILAHNTYISGNVGIGTTGPGARLQINPTVTATTDARMFQSGIVYNGATAMADWYGGYIAAPTGTGTITNILNKLGFAKNVVEYSPNNNILSCKLELFGYKYAFVTEANAGNVGIGTTSPSQALEVNGGIRQNTTTTKPTCDATTRGTTWFTQGTAGVKDSYEICAKDVGDAYSWRTIY